MGVEAFDSDQMKMLRSRAIPVYFLFSVRKTHFFVCRGEGGKEKNHKTKKAQGLGQFARRGSPFQKKKEKKKHL